MIIQLKRCSNTNKHFQQLIKQLNEEQAIRNGDKHDFYMQFNQINNLHQIVVAFNNNKPVGCGALKRFDENSLEIKRMFTIKNERNKGIAVKILKELEQWASELGFESCILETGTMNPEAIEFYKKHNYKSIPCYGQYKSDTESLCFKKKII